MPQGVVDSADRVIEGLLALTFHSIASQQLATAFQGVSAPVARLLQGLLQERCKEGLGMLVVPGWKNAPGSFQ
jgi:hypothetical protein